MGESPSLLTASQPPRQPSTPTSVWFERSLALAESCNCPGTLNSDGVRNATIIVKARRAKPAYPPQRLGKALGSNRRLDIDVDQSCTARYCRPTNVPSAVI
jgi:hypothetical protein